MKTEVKSETELNKIQSELSYLSSCVNAPKEYCMVKQPIYSNNNEEKKTKLLQLLSSRHATDGKKWTVDSVRRTDNLRCYSNTTNRGHAILNLNYHTFPVV